MNVSGWRPLGEHMMMGWVSRAAPQPDYRLTWTDATNGADRPTRVQVACGWAELHCLGLLWRLGHE
jgi:hypothetical protein